MVRNYGDPSKSLTLPVSPFRVTRDHRNRLRSIGPSHDFQLVFHSNYGSISYHFRGKGRYLRNFPTPYIYRSRRGGYHEIL